MNRTHFQTLSDLRRAEAKVLLDAGQFSGSYYLMGYAVECALKACIAKTVKRFDFPSKDTGGYYTHSLERLFQSAQLQASYAAAVAAHPGLAVNWATVKEWKETMRYEPVPVTALDANNFFTACTAKKTGVLTWVKRQW